MKKKLLTTALLLSLAGSDLVAALKYPIVGTGHTKCYDNRREIAPPKPDQPFYGQDAQHPGPVASYQDNGDGTVSDLNTGLMWIQKPPTDKCSWADAAKVSASLNAQKFAGHDDWRLPSVKELYSIVNHNQGWPYIDTKYFVCELALQIEDQVKNTQYWTSEKSVTSGGRTEAFGVNFATGHIKAYASGMWSYVRCVRGNPDYGMNDLQDDGDGTITDRATGLTWSKADSQKGLNWEAALAWVQAKNQEDYLGHHDWRLPNVGEMQSIVDYSLIPEAANSTNVATALHPLFHCTAITNQEGNTDCPYYWTSTSCYHGPTSTDYRFAWYVSFGRARNSRGGDGPGSGRARSRLVAEAGAIRYDAKVKGGPPGEGGERIYNYVRLVRGGDVTKPTETTPWVPAAVPARAQGSDAPQGGPAMSGPRLLASPIITALDLNGDGIIDADELAKASESLKKLDKNGDGKLTPDEYRPQRPGGMGGPDGGPGGQGGPGGPGMQGGGRPGGQGGPVGQGGRNVLNWTSSQSSRRTTLVAGERTTPRHPPDIMPSFAPIFVLALAAGLSAAGLRAAQPYTVVDTGQTNCYNASGAIISPPPALARPIGEERRAFTMMKRG